MTCSSFLSELVNPGHWSMRILYPASVKGLLTFRFICLASHLPCCISWFSLLNSSTTHITPSPLSESDIQWQTKARWLNEVTYLIFMDFDLSSMTVWPLFLSQGVIHLWNYTCRVLIMWFFSFSKEKFQRINKVKVQLF